MPDLLLLWNNENHRALIEATASKKEFRIRETSELSTAIELLKSRKFDIALICYGLRVPEQEEVAKHLWGLNPTAPLVIFDFEEKSKFNPFDARLFGAEVARGKDTLSIIERNLDQVKEKQPVNNEDFQIMVVEDLDSPRDIICFYVESLGFPTVVGKSSAKEALTELEANPLKYSCIITDVRMPEISGDELIGVIRKHAKLKHLPIIVLTAHGTPDTLIDCLKAGATGFLVKPPKKIDLTREISRAMRVASGRASPRLASAEEIEGLKSILINE